MQLTLIRPQFGSRAHKGYDSPARMEPVALAILAALTPRHVKIRVHDERLAPIPFHAPTDLVAISVCTFSALRAYEIAAEYRRRGVPVVMGGFHPTLCPEEALQHADAVVRGDAEHSWTKVLADFEQGRLQRLYEPASPCPAAGVIPDRSVLARRAYLPLRLIQFGRGCNRTCEFCSIRAFYGGGSTYRPVDSVLEEIRACNARRVFFVDDNIIANRARFRELLEAIVPLKLRWSTQIDFSFADDPDLIALAARSGCQSVTIGFESLHPGNLRQMGKAWNGPQSYQTRLQRLRDAGIMVYGTFVFGYDQDDPGVFARTVDFAIREKMFIANFNPLQPLPGTPLYHRLEREGRLRFPSWWLDPRYRWHTALIEPRGMTPDQLTHGCAAARRRFNSGSSIVQRFIGSVAHRASLDNAMVFLASNIISRMDIHAKSNLKLGMEGAVP